MTNVSVLFAMFDPFLHPTPKLIKLL